MGRKSLESKGKISREELYDLYVTRSLSVKAIATLKGIAQGTVYNYLVTYQIPRRPRGSRRSKDTTPEVMPFVSPVEATVWKINENEQPGDA